MRNNGENRITEQLFDGDEKIKFRDLMEDYARHGGPFIMIDLNDLRGDYGDEGISAGELITREVKAAVQYRYREKINQVVEGVATSYIYDKLADEIEIKVRDVFSNGFTTDLKGDLEVQTPADVVKNAMEDWFSVQPAPKNLPYGSGNKVEKSSLEELIKKEVTVELEKQTKIIIADVNRDVLAAAKESVSKTVSDQLFAGLNILPKINGVTQK